MDAGARIERALADAVVYAEATGSPPRLAEAVRYAVFPRGARIRPRLALAVAAACGDDEPTVSDAAAVAIELLHCASLVHDDLPCFDNADMRRGKPSVHRAFGEPLAVLAGDALIVLAFQVLARGSVRAPLRLGPLLLLVGDSVGMPYGIVAGQAWECEPRVDLAEYQRQKTGSLFAAASVAGATAAGVDGEPWRSFGDKLGEAYQVADDIRDAIADQEEMGKPAGRDAALGRPSAVRALGVAGAVARLEELAAAAAAAIPPCPGEADLRALIRSEATRLLPKKLSRHAA
jgi:geranylgeranyl diphosphate synthase type II